MREPTWYWQQFYEGQKCSSSKNTTYIENNTTVIELEVRGLGSLKIRMGPTVNPNLLAYGNYSRLTPMSCSLVTLPGDTVEDDGA